ncbi:hypothetical protein CSOJ01_09857 [Colletotrichum sojae]|uniref:Uncharacterized protein n=1 Tax=Colletotrichum sojae TaxID=2175907 RepID=A0A8H6J1W1_9PEZI|nr:hypothetical protein CSOJ01_09857 [Colletotrichum sojae]
MYQHINHEKSDDPRSVLEESKSITNEQDEPLKPQHEPLSDKSAQTSQQLSLKIRLSILISLFSIAASVAFISWLWWTPHEDRRWRAWVLAPNRLQLSITLASIVIRAAVGAIATVTTAMVASAAAERRGVQLHAVSQISIARFSNRGQLSHGLLTLRGSALDPVIRLIVALLVLATLAAQFTSTLLVSDLEHGRGARLAETFAEYSREPAAVEGLDDTGPNVRAFLPMASQEARESLLEFRGRAWLMDSRVMCMRPELKDVRICNFFTLCGSVRLERSVAEAAGLGVIKIDVFRDFRCPINQAWHICWNSSLTYYGMDTKWDLRYNHSHWLLGGISIELFFDTSTFWNLLDINGSWLTGPTTMQNSTSNGPWTQYASKNYIEQLNIQASSSKNRSEPAYAWDVNRGDFNTSAVRRQLGAVKDVSSISPEDRQILSIDQESFGSSLAEARGGGARKMHKWGGSMTQEWARPLMANRETSNVGQLGSLFYLRLFNDTIRETGSPARALQAIYFTVARVSYYNLMIAFSPNTETPEAATAEIVTFEPTQVLTNRRGYWAVIGILAVFLATSAVVAVLFWSTRYSLIGNSWHAVAQISGSEELVDLLREAKLATDDEIERLIKGNSKTIPPPPSGVGLGSYGKGVILHAIRGSVDAFASLITFGRAGNAPRFVIRDGVFVRASRVGVDMELKGNVSRRRLTRKASLREVIDGRSHDGQSTCTLHASSRPESRSGSPEDVPGLGSVDQDRST